MISILALPFSKILFTGNLKGRDHLDDLGQDGTIILRLTVVK
jgi:hypothetical protein